MSITNPQTVVNIAVAQINNLRKIEGTSYWHSDQWFDKLADYSNAYDCGAICNVCGTFRQWKDDVPNRRNVQKWRDFIAKLAIPKRGDEGQIPADLKVALLDHLDALLAMKLKSEFRFQFSRTRGWKYMRDISAASCFLNSFSQACNYGH
jgi:hypothetical protein